MTTVTQVLGENQGEHLTMSQIEQEDRRQVYDAVCNTLIKTWVRAHLSNKTLKPRQYVINLEDGRSVFYPVQFTTLSEAAETV